MAATDDVDDTVGLFVLSRNLFVDCVLFEHVICTVLRFRNIYNRAQSSQYPATHIHYTLQRCAHDECVYPINFSTHPNCILNKRDTMSTHALTDKRVPTGEKGISGYSVYR